MRKSFIVFFSAAATLLLSAGAAQATFITTTFASNNQFDGNMFDVTTLGSSLLVTGLSVNVNTTGNFNIDVYTKAGTYAGFEQNAAPWSLIASGSAIGQGTDTPSFVDISDFFLPGSGLTGMYVTLNPAPGAGGLGPLMRYTNGANTYSNADVMINTGAGIGGLFGTYFTGRTWNGTIHYDKLSQPVPEPSTIVLLGTSLVGLVGYGWRRKKVA